MINDVVDLMERIEQEIKVIKKKKEKREIGKYF